MGDSLLEALERVAGRHEALQPRHPHQLEGELERRPRASWAALHTVGVGAAERDLPLPEWRQVEADRPGHADEGDLTTGPRDGERLPERLRAPDAVEDDVDAAGEALDLPRVLRPGEGERARDAGRPA